VHINEDKVDMMYLRSIEGWALKETMIMYNMAVLILYDWK
jgi:hypothetical protein